MAGGAGEGRMLMAATDTRRQIVEAADRRFYEQGFEATSFADIAADVGLSRGNFYYHFKAKDEILDAVIALRLENTKAMLEGWEAEAATPRERIGRFVHILIANQTKIMAYGCPVGTLSNELAKLDHVARGDAAELFILFRRWLGRRFAELGRAADADELAMHVLMHSQGVATLAAALGEEDFIRREVEAMDAWLDAIAAGTEPASSPD